MSSDYFSLAVVFIFLGGVNILLGLLMRKYKFVDIISGYNPKKDDKERTAQLFSISFILMGSLAILVSGIYIIYPFDITIFTVAQVLIIFGCIIYMGIRSSKDNKK